MFELLISPLLGIVGGAVSSWMAYKNKKADQEHEIKMAEEDRKTRQVEAECQIKITQETFDGKAYVASQQAGSEILLDQSSLRALLKGNWWMRLLGGLIAFLLGLVQAIRGLLRPALTAGLFVACYYILTMFVAKVGWGDVALMQNTVSYGIQSMFNLLSTCVAWWFGDRTMSRRLVYGTK